MSLPQCITLAALVHQLRQIHVPISWIRKDPPTAIAVQHKTIIVNLR